MIRDHHRGGPTLRVRLLALLAKRGPMTTAELARALGYDAATNAIYEALAQAEIERGEIEWRYVPVTPGYPYVCRQYRLSRGSAPAPGWRRRMPRKPSKGEK